MMIKVGEFANRFVWQVVREGKILEQGHHEELRQAREDAENAARFWQLHDYEYED